MAFWNKAQEPKLNPMLVNKAKAILTKKGHPLTALAIETIYRDLELKAEQHQNDAAYGRVWES